MKHSLLTSARDIFAARPQLYFLIGGSCTGKTTLTQAIAALYQLPIIDMDTHIYGDYHSRFTAEAHPASYAWSTAENGLAWLLSKNWPAFDQFNAESNREYLVLLAEDLLNHDPQKPILVDGGFSKPGLLAQFVPISQIICLALPEGVSGRIWNEDPARLPMKEMVEQLTAPPDAWNHFLRLDSGISQTMVTESEAHGIRVIYRDEKSTVAGLMAQIAEYWNLNASSNNNS